MKSRQLLLAASLVAAFAVTPLGSAAPTPTTHAFPSVARIVGSLFGFPFDLTLSGPTTVTRGDYDRSTQTFDTEIVSLNLTGTTSGPPFANPGQAAAVHVQAGRQLGTQPIVGKITNAVVQANGELDGGDSTFTFPEKNLSFENPSGQLHARVQLRPPLVMAAHIYSLPPNRPVLTQPKVGAVDDFKCYGVKVRSGFKQATVKLKDQFETGSAQLTKPLSLCAPVSKNGSRLRKSFAHLKCYAIRGSSPHPKEPEVEVGIQNQFGTATLAVLQPRSLCVPTLTKRLAKVQRAPAPPKGSLARLTDHFKCYDAKPKGSFEQRVVALSDQLETERARVLRPMALCAPVEKNVVLIRDSVTHLTCYAIQDLSRKEKPGGRLVVVRHQLGVEVPTVLKPQTLCVPSTKTPPCTPYLPQTKSAIVVRENQLGTIESAAHIPYHGVEGSPCQ